MSINWAQKLSSRKLWATIAGICVGIATVLGADGSDINIMAGAFTSAVSVVAYIVTEGKIDIVRVGGGANGSDQN